MTPPDTIGSTVGDVAAALTAAGFDEPRRRARRLVAAALGVSAAEVFSQLDRMIPAADSERVAELLTRMLRHEPLSRILGRREFWGLEFHLSADTLDPRPETETVVEAVLARLTERTRPYRFLDLGTGSGCLLLSLLAEFRAASGVGVDRAPGAVLAARANAVRLGLAARAAFVVGDWAAALAGAFDAIVANPPYIATGDIAALPREVRDFDPHRALDGGPDGLDAYRAIAAVLPRLLAPGGVFAAEIGQGQEGAVAALLAGRGLAIDEVVPDLAGIPRCVVARPRR
ncbi:MAG TPA: peptide chain release factor N(5)-glutamine methyltransferase [Stellaceae bacterium]|nr:peptide chain release factor N(5)-glutamine methyltransferase [Stellaceae bacterium]